MPAEIEKRFRELSFALDLIERFPPAAKNSFFSLFAELIDPSYQYLKKTSNHLLDDLKKLTEGKLTDAVTVLSNMLPKMKGYLEAIEPNVYQEFITLFNEFLTSSTDEILLHRQYYQFEKPLEKVANYLQAKDIDRHQKSKLEYEISQLYAAITSQEPEDDDSENQLAVLLSLRSEFKPTDKQKIHFFNYITTRIIRNEERDICHPIDFGKKGILFINVPGTVKPQLGTEPYRKNVYEEFTVDFFFRPNEIKKQSVNKEKIEQSQLKDKKLYINFFIGYVSPEKIQDKNKFWLGDLANIDLYHQGLLSRLNFYEIQENVINVNLLELMCNGSCEKIERSLTEIQRKNITYLLENKDSLPQNLVETFKTFLQDGTITKYFFTSYDTHQYALVLKKINEVMKQKDYERVILNIWGHPSIEIKSNSLHQIKKAQSALIVMRNPDPETYFGHGFSLSYTVILKMISVLMRETKIGETIPLSLKSNSCFSAGEAYHSEDEILPLGYELSLQSESFVHCEYGSGFFNPSNNSSHLFWQTPAGVTTKKILENKKSLLEKNGLFKITAYKGESQLNDKKPFHAAKLEKKSENANIDRVKFTMG